MSEVLKFFEEHFNPSDSFHQMLAARPTMTERLRAIQADSLKCCGMEMKKNGAIELLVVDKEGFDRLQEEKTSIEARLAALDALVARLDQIFADADRQGISIYTKTPSGILREEVGWRNKHRQESREPWNPNSRTVGIPNPALVELLRLTDAALEAAQVAGWA